MPDKYNAFISYAWVDNEVPVHRNKGWVSLFVDRLRGHLGRELGRQVEADRIWIDYEQMRGNEPLSDKIRGELTASRLLIPVVSPSYYASPWCCQELATFLDLHGEKTDRIFPVWMEPVDSKKIPKEARHLAAVLDERLKYQFWYQDEQRQVRTRWFPQIKPADRDFGRVQQDLARDMAALLRAIAGQEQPEQATPEPDQTPSPTIEGEHLIMVNGGDDDTEHVLWIAERLWEDHRVSSVIPLVAQQDRTGLKPSEITKDLRDNLGLCTGVLVVYCAGPQHQIHQQLKEYRRHIAKLPQGKRPPRLVLCHDPSQPLTFRLPGMKIFPVNGDECAGDCLRAIVAELA